MDFKAFSVIQPYGVNETECGYCDNISDSSKKYGIVSSHMSVDDYEALMMRGWRRSGDYFYKPIMSETCCPQYTIRVNLNKFKISKSQKQILRRFERYIQTGDVHENPHNNTTTSTSITSTSSIQSPDISSTTEQNTSSSSSSISHNILPLSFTIETVLPEATIERFELYKKYQIAIHGDKEEEITIEGFSRFLVHSPLFDNIDINTTTTGGSTGNSSGSSSSTNYYFYEDRNDTSIHKAKKYQMSANVKKLKSPSHHPIFSDILSSSLSNSSGNTNHMISTTTNSNSTDYNKSNSNNNTVHNTTTTTNNNDDKSSIERKYGTYHQLYRINNQLIAVGVIDLIKSGLSSVYLFYDPEYRFLVPGKLTALKELEYCQSQGLEYYYMGYYVHNCIKMKYKAEFSPSELLCPKTYIFYPFDSICKTLLDKYTFIPFDPIWSSQFVTYMNSIQNTQTTTTHTYTTTHTTTTSTSDSAQHVKDTMNSNNNNNNNNNNNTTTNNNSDDKDSGGECNDVTTTETHIKMIPIEFLPQTYQQQEYSSKELNQILLLYENKLYILIDFSGDYQKFVEEYILIPWIQACGGFDLSTRIIIKLS